VVQVTGDNSLTATAVLCSRDGGELLAPALEDLRSALGPRDRALVVDSGSRSSGVADAARAARIECIRVDLPGLSKARNAALRHVSTDIIAFTDDDCRAAPDWLDRIRRHFSDPNVAFVTGRVASTRASGARASTLERDELVRYTGAQDPAGIGHGANMAFRTRALVAIGGFDEALGAGSTLRAGEDADALYRCLAAGWEGVYDPASLVTHEQWRRGGELIRLRYGYGLGNGAFRVKAALRDPRAGGRLLVHSLWKQGLRPTFRALKPARLRALPGTASWTAGMLVGMARGLALESSRRRVGAAR
jgi:glycosyltransferase involved in cell wall biosynthesis